MSGHSVEGLLMLERTVDQGMMFVLVAVPKGVLAARP